MAITRASSEVDPGQIPGQIPGRIDDYHVDRESGRVTRPAIHHLLALAKALLLITLAAVSFALFLVVASLLGVA